MSAVVLPFRRPQKSRAKDVTHCPECGWKMPTEFWADRDAVNREIVLRFDCPECGSMLFLEIEFEPDPNDS